MWPGWFVSRETHRWHESWYRTTRLDPKPLFPKPGILNLQLFPLSSPLIGSMFGWTVLLMALQSIQSGPQGSRLCLFIQIAGKHSVFRKRRQLLLQFCPLFVQHSIVPHLSKRTEFLPPFSDTWHRFSKDFTYIPLPLEKQSLTQTRSTQYLSKWDALFVQS